MLAAVRPPFLLRRFYSRFTWRIPSAANEVYLTFDDGPIPGPTEFVLDCLASYNIKATFFCTGDNVRKHQQLYNRLLTEGHKVGNHTFSHLNGWKTATEKYVSDFNQAVPLIDTDLFRPPYGRIRKAQADYILKGHKIIMWDILSYDFDKNISPQKCLNNVIKNVRPGSIIVFHDSIKAFKNLEYALPKALKYFKERNFQCEVIKCDSATPHDN
jgi:peptidoglycan-N-acetylglucosamine deacetylase